MIPADENSIQARNWFALYTKPRNEFKAAAQLEKICYEYYLPVFEKVKTWSDRQKKVTEPVLRGYIFIHVNEKERLAALKINSIIKCVSNNGKPERIPCWQIENLKIMLRNISGFSVYEGILPGTEVEILDGPLKGVIGKIISGEKEKLAVCINLLNRSVVTYLPKESRLKFLHKVIR